MKVTLSAWKNNGSWVNIVTKFWSSANFNGTAVEISQLVNPRTSPAMRGPPVRKIIPRIHGRRYK